MSEGSVNLNFIPNAVAPTELISGMWQIVFMMGLNRAPHAFCVASLIPHLQMRDGQLGLGDSLGTRVTFWFQNSQVSNFRSSSIHTGPLDPHLQALFLSPGPILV